VLLVLSAIMIQGFCVEENELVVRPVLEYACPFWHWSLTATQTKTLELLQQRAMKIIFPAVKDYTLSLIFANVDT